MKRIIAMILCVVLVIMVVPIHSVSAEESEKEEKQSEEELTQKYEQGITMEPEQVQARKERVEELGLQEHVDEQYFLYSEYYNQYSIDELEQKGLMLLVRVMTEEEIEAWEMRLKYGIAPMYITMDSNVLAWTNDAGITSRTYAFDVDGHIAFCGDAKFTPPATGTPHSDYILVTNPQIKKILYYGYGGPEDQTQKLGYSKAQSYNIVAIAISNIRKGEALGAGGRLFWDAIKNLPDPPAGEAYYVDTFTDGVQDLFFYIMPKKGKLQIKKSSANTGITNGNGCYSFKGAEFGVYTNSDGTSGQVGTLVTGADGASQILELDAGTYYVKELKAPPGFALDSTIQKVTVAADATVATTFNVKDKPQMNPMDILLEKVDAETKKNEPQGSGTLKGAQFTVKFYAGLWGKNEDPGTLGKTPAREWVFETDEKGICRYDTAHLVSGDELYYLKADTPALPLGTITIQETKASEGYLINQITYILQITSEGTAETVHTYNQSTISENIFKLNLVKKQEGTDIVIPNAEFKHTKPDGTSEVLKTDSEGKLTFKGLQYGVHHLTEISVNAGYEINKADIMFTVAEDNTVTHTVTSVESDGKVTFEITEDGNIKIEMEDKLSPFNLNIHKINNKNEKLDGAEFTLYAEKECITEVAKGVTANGGLLHFTGLAAGKKYYLKETKAPEGYRISTDALGNPVIYEVITESTPTAERELERTIENKVERQLPVTGSAQTIVILLTSITCFVAALIYSKKRSRE